MKTKNSNPIADKVAIGKTTSRILLVVITALLSFSSAFAKKNETENKQMTTYNMTRGIEEMYNENYSNAVSCFNAELREDPKNGYAYYWLAYVNLNQEEYSDALTAINSAIKYIPKKDKTYKAATFYARAEIHSAIEEEDEALKDLTTAIEYDPEKEPYYYARAWIYYGKKKYDLAKADYKKITSINPGSVAGYMGLGWTAAAQENHEEAIKHYSYVIKLSSSTSNAYAYRAQSYIELKKYDEAINDIFTAIDIDYNTTAYYLLLDVAKIQPETIIARLKIQCAKNPNQVGYWHNCLGRVYENQENYAKAIEEYKLSFKAYESASSASDIADCYSELENYNAALKYINTALELYPSYVWYMTSKADILDNLGNTADAISLMTECITNKPEYSSLYYSRGLYKEYSNDLDGAIEDYTFAIALYPDYVYAHFRRAETYTRKGETALAQQDYQKVVELDTVPDNYSYAQFALQALGENAKAIDFMNRIIEADTAYVGNYYNAACLYARMRDSEKSIDYLRIALEKGYHEFNHIEKDTDLDSVRNLDEFKALIEQYKTPYLLNNDFENDEADENATYTESVAEIPYTKEYGVCKVQCAINNLPLYFIFDTGAADVTISNVEAAFMLKNGYLTANDIVGSRYYQDANGDINEGTLINLKDVEFGGLHLTDVIASVTHSQNAPLLLGQTVLQKLGKVEIDNEQKVIKITRREKK